ETVNYFKLSDLLLNLYLYTEKVDKKIILFIGGPGTGKTSLINALQEKGYICYPEISRSVTLEAQKKGIDQLFLTEPLLFSELLLDRSEERRVGRESRARE